MIPLCVNLAYAFFSIAIAPESQEQFAFTWEERQWTFLIFPQGYVHSPTLCHRLRAQDLSTWKQPPAVHLYYYIDDIMLTPDSLTELEAAATSL